MSFENQTALVTGASSGIGKALAAALMARGAALCLVGRNAEALRAVAAASGSAVCHPADLRVEKEIHELAERVRNQWIRLDVLIHCAGSFSMGRVEQAPASELDEMYRVNLRAPYVLTQTLLPLLKQSQGQVVFANSSTGLSGRSSVSQYAATKHALKALAESLREEVNAAGVRVLNLFLGRTASAMQRAVHRMEGKSYRPEALIQPDDIATMVLSALSLPRTAEVTEIHIRPMRKPS